MIRGTTRRSVFFAQSNAALRSLCVSKGLPIAGIKKVLVSRLVDAAFPIEDIDGDDSMGNDDADGMSVGCGEGAAAGVGVGGDGDKDRDDADGVDDDGVNDDDDDGVDDDDDYDGDSDGDADMFTLIGGGGR